MASDVVIEIELDDGSIKKGFAKIKKGSEKLGDEVGKNVTSGITDAFKRIGPQIAAFASVGKLANDFVKFGTALAEIRTITNGLNIDQKELNKTLVSASKQFGTSAQEQAKSFYQIISAGITDAASAQETLIAANKLAIGGLTSTSGAVDLLTSAVNAYGQENLGAAKAADIIFGTVRLGKTRVEELQSALGQILPTASSLGVSFEEISGNLAQLTTKGVSTSEAVTQLNAVLTAVLKKGAARNLGPKVAEAFSLQALQAKGLTGFLKDLNATLGGSEEKLVKLLGRAEGARAIIALAGDGFKGAADKVDQLKNSSGAANEAFGALDQTVGQQLNRTLAIFSSTVTNTVASTNEGFVKALELVNDGLELLVDNLGRVIRAYAIFLGITKSGKIFNALSIGARKLSATIAGIPSGIQLTIFQFQRLRAQGVGTFAALTKAIKVTNIGLKTLRIGVKLLKAGLTLGLTIAIDFLIEKFIELQDKVGSIANVFKFIGLSIQKVFIKSIIAIQTKLLEFSPQIASFLGVTAASVRGLGDELARVNDEIDKLANTPLPDGTGGDTGGGDEEAPVEGDTAFGPLTPETVEEQQTLLEGLKQGFTDAFAFINDGADVTNDRLKDLNAQALKDLKKVGAQFAKGFARSFAAVGGALAKGEDAFAAFGKAITGVLGDAAINAGQTYLLLGLASYNFGQAALGASLIVLGGALKSLAGGGSSGTANAPTGGSPDEPGSGDSDSFGLDDSSVERRNTEVVVNVEGNVIESGENLVALLQETFDTTGAQVVQG